MRYKHLLSAALIALLINAAAAQSKLKAGIWRGTLKTSSGNELPFNFEVKDISGKQQLAIINGTERFKVTDVKQKGDSVFIHMPLFNSEFRLKLTAGNLTGKWIKN